MRHYSIFLAQFEPYRIYTHEEIFQIMEEDIVSLVEESFKDTTSMSFKESQKDWEDFKGSKLLTHFKEFKKDWENENAKNEIGNNWIIVTDIINLETALTLEEVFKNYDKIRTSEILPLCFAFDNENQYNEIMTIIGLLL